MNSPHCMHTNAPRANRFHACSSLWCASLWRCSLVLLAFFCCAVRSCGSFGLSSPLLASLRVPSSVGPRCLAHSALLCLSVGCVCALSLSLGVGCCVGVRVGVCPCLLAAHSRRTPSAPVSIGHKSTHKSTPHHLPLPAVLAYAPAASPSLSVRLPPSAHLAATAPVRLTLPSPSF